MGFGPDDLQRSLSSLNYFELLYRAFFIDVETLLKAVVCALAWNLFMGDPQNHLLMALIAKSIGLGRDVTLDTI